MGGGNRSSSSSSDRPGHSGDTGENDNEDNYGGPAMGEKCAIRRDTTLASPKPGPLNSVSVGDDLPVELRGSSVDVLNSSGDAIGSIAERWVSTLKECIEDGYQYKAKVQSKNRGSCTVFVHNV